jgi:branched-subunit amino acid ABC-type transport system permease component
MLGGMLAWVFLGLGPRQAPAIVIAIAITVVVGIIVQRLTIRPPKYPIEITYMATSICTAPVIRGIILLTCNLKKHTIKPFTAIEPIHFLEANLTPQAIFV